MTKLALCVGINDYPGSGSDLYGCVNDAYDWGAALSNRGYEIKYLIDGAATKAAIHQALLDSREKLRWRDKFVFQFSGHGTWMPDADGDEADGRDEALCCYDYASGGLLKDDELQSIFGGFRWGVSSLIISDSCHSGTIARGLVPLTARAKFLSPADIDTIPVNERQAIRLEQKATTSTSRGKAVLMSGCDDPEYSYDANYGGRPNGAFTRVALDTLTALGALTYRDWHTAIRGLLPSTSYPQSPQLQATYYQSKKVAFT